MDDEALLDREGLPADLAAERLEPGVPGQVSLERAHLCEGLLAHVALESKGKAERFKRNKDRATKDVFMDLRSFSCVDPDVFLR